MLSALNDKCFFALIKRNGVGTVDTEIIYILKSGIVLFGPAGGIMCLINTIKKRKKIEFLLDCLSTYNCKHFIQS